MKKLLLSLFVLQLSLAGFSQQRLKAVIAGSYASGNKITIFWERDATATSYLIYRKNISDKAWPAALANLGPNDSFWVDNNAAGGTEYEYMISKANGTADAKYGFVQSGINVPAKHNRGIMLLVIDTAIANQLPMETERLQFDLLGDGWQLEVIYVSPGDAVTAVKSKIITAWNKNPSNTKSVFLLGRVPVPYSGDMAPDGHTNNHYGAWPADTYYADMDGLWTDNSVTSTAASRVQNQNAPGDGKFDQSIIPSSLELAVGRVDFNGMTTFDANYVNLVKRYLDKNHNYRHKNFEVKYQAVVEDNFAGMAEFFSGSALRSFGSLVGPEKIIMDDIVSFSQNEGALFSYGCGAGSYTTASGVGSTATYNDSSIKTVFTMQFGSYFGDWDSDNNFLRAPLAGPGTALVNIWAGRPHFHLHQLATGYPIGHATLLGQNNPTTAPYYVPGYGTEFVHTALMGDPSLRIHTLKAPSSVTTTPSINIDGTPKVVLTWTAPTENVDGYFVYRSDNKLGPYQLISPSMVTDLSFHSEQPSKGMNYYQVRAAKLETRSGASYINLSQGVFDTIGAVRLGIEVLTVLENVSVYPIPSTGSFFIESEYADVLNIRLTDITGKAINFKSYVLSGKQEIHFPAGTPAGTYLLQIEKDGSQKTEKIVLIR